MGNELVVEKSWWKKNWKWFLPTLTLIFFPFILVNFEFKH